MRSGSRWRKGIGAGLATAALLTATACDGGAAADDDDDATGGIDGGALPPPDQYLFGGDRQVELQIPSDYDHRRAYPLVILLHGYSADGFTQQAYLGFGRLVDDDDVLLLAPDGRVDASGNRYWDYLGPSEDVTYVGSLIDDVSAVYHVDPGRVFLFGHSNGAFLSYRMACERSDAIAGIIALAGNANDADPCQPEAPVSVVHMHGDADTVVAYDGAVGYRSAVDSVAKWAALDGCGGALDDSGERLDLDSNVAGDETRIARTAGCADGVAAELWTLAGSGHIPAFGSDLVDVVWAWYDSHARER